MLIFIEKGEKVRDFPFSFSPFESFRFRLCLVSLECQLSGYCGLVPMCSGPSYNLPSNLHNRP